MKFLIVGLFCFSWLNSAKAEISQRCMPKTHTISGNKFTAVVQGPSSIACGQEILKDSSVEYIIMTLGLDSLVVSDIKKGSRYIGSMLFYVGSFSSVAEAVPLFCDESLPIEIINEGTLDVSVLCTPIK